MAIRWCQAITTGMGRRTSRFGGHRTEFGIYSKARRDLPRCNSVYRRTGSFRRIMTATGRPTLRFIATELSVFGTSCRARPRLHTLPRNSARQTTYRYRATTMATETPTLRFGVPRTEYGSNCEVPPDFSPRNLAKPADR